jgi:serine/threonine protein kinase
MINCPYCFNLINDDSSKCPVCGGDVETGSVSYCPLAEGSVIYLKYKIEKVLGQGGFGITYLAYDEKLDRKVAVKEYFPYGIATRTGAKVTMPPTSDNQENLQNFKNEAKTIAKLKNPGIVDVYDVIDENGTIYIIMEYVEGILMSSLLGKVNEKEAVKYIKHVADTIGAVHAAGLLHQDIKPDNIIKKNSGDIKIIDFGSSRIFSADKTKTYEKILTSGYAPLEQYGCKVKRGEYTDVYAICATLYAAIKGVPPPEATDLAAGADIDFTGISIELKKILAKGLSIKISDRIKNTAELIKCLDEFENPAQISQELQGSQYKPSENLKIIDKPAIEVAQPDSDRHETYKASNNNVYGRQGDNYKNKLIILTVIITGVIILTALIAFAGYYYYARLKNRHNGKNNYIYNSRSQNKKERNAPKAAASISSAGIQASTSAANINKSYAQPPVRQYTAPVPAATPVQAPPVAPKAVKNKSNFFNAGRQTSNIFNGAGYQDFNISGCFYCHNIDGKGEINGYSLSHIGSRLSFSQIKNQIIHPDSSMPPNSNMPAEEVSQIASWLENLK